MITVLSVAKERREQIPAVVHVDGTARPQTVSRSTNPRYWQLIREFECLTGVPMLLNTSFNIQEPIVCQPEDAIRTFQGASFDALVLENHLVLRGSVETGADLVADLAARTRHEDLHVLPFEAALLSGSHHQRFARYHSTVSASASSRVRCLTQPSAVIFAMSTE